MLNVAARAESVDMLTLWPTIIEGNHNNKLGLNNCEIATCENTEPVNARWSVKRHT